MARKIFVNISVKDLPKSIAFYSAVGFTVNKQFTDETAACMVISEDIYTMLLTEKKFKDFTPNPICDAKKSTEAILCLSTESRAELEETVRKAAAAGGTIYAKPQEHGFMYQHGFQDLDGHIWELVYMEPGFAK